MLLKLNFHQEGSTLKVFSKNTYHLSGISMRKGIIVVILLVPWNYASIVGLELNSYYSACKEHVIRPQKNHFWVIPQKEIQTIHYSSPLLLFSMYNTVKGKLSYKVLAGGVFQELFLLISKFFCFLVAASIST